MSGSYKYLGVTGRISWIVLAVAFFGSALTPLLFRPPKAYADSVTFISSTTWTVPEAVSSVTIEVWAGGGSGGGSGALPSGGGGGGGAYSKLNSFAVTVGNSYTVTVGIGGGNPGGGNNGVAGGDSWFNSTSTVLAKGGGGGVAGTGIGTNGTGGGGGAAASGVGDVKFSGGAGSTANGGAFSGSGGGGAGSTGNGGNANGGSGGTGTTVGGGNGANGVANGSLGISGSVAGGGGSGGGSGNHGSGNGARGQVVITYMLTPVVSISVSDAAVSYGILAAGATKDTTSSGINDTQSAINVGNVTEDFNLKGQNSAAWTLGSLADNEQYVHYFCTTGSGSPDPCDASPTWVALTTTYQALATSIAINGSQRFDLKINAPSSTTTTVQQSVDVIVQAVQH